MKFNKGMLGKMDMPAASKPKAAKKTEPDYEADLFGDDESEEGEGAEPSPFADASDDELLAEAKKRGLKVEMPPEEDEEDEEEESGMETGSDLDASDADDELDDL